MNYRITHVPDDLARVRAKRAEAQRAERETTHAVGMLGDSLRLGAQAVARAAETDLTALPATVATSAGRIESRVPAVAGAAARQAVATVESWGAVVAVGANALVNGMIGMVAGGLVGGALIALGAPTWPAVAIACALFAGYAWFGPWGRPSPAEAPSGDVDEVERQRAAANAGVNAGLGVALGTVVGLAAAPVVGVLAAPIALGVALAGFAFGPRWF